MNKYVSVYFIVAIIGFFNCQTIADAQTSTANLSYVFSPGIAFGYDRWFFIDDFDKNKYHVNSMLGYSTGIHYGPFLKIDGAYFFSSVELGFGNQKTKSYKIDPWGILHRGEESLAYLEINRIPIMLWITISTGTKLSPFIRIGSGISHTEFKEVYSYSTGPTVQFSRWAFTWGIGGGIGMKISDDVNMSLYLDDWVTNARMERNVPRSSKVNGPGNGYKMTIVGMKVLMKLKSFID